MTFYLNFDKNNRLKFYFLSFKVVTLLKLIVVMCLQLLNPPNKYQFEKNAFQELNPTVIEMFFLNEKFKKRFSIVHYFC